MIHALLEFVANSVRVSSRPGNGRSTVTYLLIVVVIGVALGVAFYLA